MIAVGFFIGYLLRAWLVPRPSFESRFFEGFGRAYLKGMARKPYTGTGKYWGSGHR